jgi:hypothetical protein
MHRDVRGDLLWELAYMLMETEKTHFGFELEQLGNHRLKYWVAISLSTGVNGPENQES